jgi:hypothetical protein
MAAPEKKITLWEAVSRPRPSLDSPCRHKSAILIG